MTPPPVYSTNSTATDQPVGQQLVTFLRRVRVFLAVYYALMIEYRGEILLWVFATALPLIMLGLWYQAASDSTFALSPDAMLRYFLAVFFVRQLVVVWVIHEFEWEIVSGRLTPYLLWPLDPAWRYVAAHLSEQLARVPFFLLVMGLVIWMFPEALHDTETGTWWSPKSWQLLLAIPAIYSAWLMRFLIQYTIALGAFWVERVQSFENLAMLPYLFLSGMAAPLDVFPPLAQKIAMWTPFPYMIYFPATLVTGRATNIVQGFAVITAWIVGLFLLNRFIWRRGVKNYSAMGA